MKRLFCFLTLALAFIGNAMAWEPVIREIHYFGMYYPDSYEPVESSEINCFSSNGYTHDLNYMKFKNRNQPNTPKVTFRSWTDNSKTRFALNNPEIIGNSTKQIAHTIQALAFIISQITQLMFGFGIWIQAISSFWSITEMVVLEISLNLYSLTMVIIVVR